MVAEALLGPDLFSLLSFSRNDFHAVAARLLTSVEKD
jgi:hypothetical protein